MTCEAQGGEGSRRGQTPYLCQSWRRGCGVEASSSDRPTTCGRGELPAITPLGTLAREEENGGTDGGRGIRGPLRGKGSSLPQSCLQGGRRWKPSRSSGRRPTKMGGGIKSNKRVMKLRNLEKQMIDYVDRFSLTPVALSTWMTAAIGLLCDLDPSHLDMEQAFVRSRRHEEICLHLPHEYIG